MMLVCLMLCFLLIFFLREKKKKPKTKTTLFHWETHDDLMIWIDFWWGFFRPLSKHHLKKKYHRVPCLLGLPSIHHLHHSVDAWSPSELYHSEAQHVAAWSIRVRLPFREQTNVSSTQMCLFKRGYVGFWVDLHLPTRWMKIFSTQNHHLNHHLAVDIGSSHWNLKVTLNDRSYISKSKGQPWNLLPHSWTLKLAVSSSGGSGHCVSVEIVACHDLSWACWKVTVIHMFKKYSQYCNTDDGRNPANQLIW